MLGRGVCYLFAYQLCLLRQQPQIYQYGIQQTPLMSSGNIPPSYTPGLDEKTPIPVTAYPVQSSVAVGSSAVFKGQVVATFFFFLNPKFRRHSLFRRNTARVPLFHHNGQLLGLMLTTNGVCVWLPDRARPLSG